VVVTVIASFIGQVNSLLGPDKVWKLFLGMYYNPKEEFRFFLFIDLRNSTEHAEEMGRQRYSQFIQDFMFRANLLVRKYEAEIYQYVGDEVVLTWTLEEGLRNENCIQYYFALQRSIYNDREYFRKKYGLIPEFKAGLNAGKVIVAEVGRIKKEIAYHGGTIITASRIQEQCNHYGVSILAGESILELIPEPRSFKADFVGEVRLKGKSRNKKIYAISET
jgi:adenylate cyclase